MNDIIKQVKSEKILMHEDGTFDEIKETLKKEKFQKKKKEPVVIEID